jgi:hypothetical protein
VRGRGRRRLGSKKRIKCILKKPKNKTETKKNVKDSETISSLVVNLKKFI